MSDARLTHDGDPYLEELVKIRKTLEDIEFILECECVPRYETENLRGDNGKCEGTKRKYYVNPLEALREKVEAYRGKTITKRRQYGYDYKFEE